jgi:hypothetical protein
MRPVKLLRVEDASAAISRARALVEVPEAANSGHPKIAPSLRMMSGQLCKAIQLHSFANLSLSTVFEA